MLTWPKPASDPGQPWTKTILASQTSHRHPSALLPPPSSLQHVSAATSPLLRPFATHCSPLCGLGVARNSPAPTRETFSPFARSRALSCTPEHSSALWRGHLHRRGIQSLSATNGPPGRGRRRGACLRRRPMGRLACTGRRRLCAPLREAMWRPQDEGRGRFKERG